MMRVVAFGGRDYAEGDIVYAALDHIHARIGISLLIEGEATGADTLAKLWAEERGVPKLPFFPDWDNLTAPGAVIRTNKFGKQYNVRAGLDRNQRMIDEGKPDLGVQFPGGNGTGHMRAQMDRARIPVIRVYSQDFVSHVFENICHRAEAQIGIGIMRFFA